MVENQNKIPLIYGLATQFIRQINTFSHKGKKIGSGILCIHLIGQNSKITLGEMIEILNIPPSTATRITDNLVELKLIERRMNEEDRRGFRFSLTKEGLEIYSRFQLHQEHFNSVIGKEHSTSEISNFFNVLQTISKNSNILLVIN